MRIKMNERVERFKAYYAKQNGRPLLGFFVGSEFPLFQYKNVAGLPEDRPLTPADFNPKSFAKDCRRIFERHEEYGGDFI